MADVAAPPVPDVMEGVVADTAAAAAPADPVVPEEPEFASETLYIQNLNEKIKIDGNTHLFLGSPVWSSSYSPQGLFTRVVQVVR